MPERHEQHSDKSHDAMSRAFAALELGPGASIEQVVNQFAELSKRHREKQLSDSQYEQVKEAYKIFAAYFKKDHKTLERILQNHPEYLYLKQELHESKDSETGHIDRIA